MQENKQSESGSMMIEIIAVLALLAMMTPIVYQQALKRNIEVSNINMADEMRAVRDSVKAYLDANKESIALDCGAQTTGVMNDCTDYISLTALEKYFSVGLASDFALNGAVDGTTPETYNLNVYAYYNQTESTDSSGTEQVTTPVVFGLISMNTQPENLKQKRAMKIASLIGAGGGICTTSTSITGSYAAWTLDSGDVNDLSSICFDNSDGSKTVVVRTDI